MSVSALITEPFEVRSRNSAEGFTLIMDWMSLKDKVVGQRSRSPSKKNVSFQARAITCLYTLLCDIMVSCISSDVSKEPRWGESTPACGRCSNTLVFFTINVLRPVSFDVAKLQSFNTFKTFLFFKK